MDPPQPEETVLYKAFRRGRVWYTRIKEGSRLRKVSLRYNGDSQREANRLAYERQREAGNTPDHAANLAEALGRLIDTKRGDGKAAGTLSMYEVKARQLTRLLGESTDVREIDARAIDGYVEQRRAEGAANGTIGKELTTLRGALRICRRRREYDLDARDVMPVGWSNEYVPRRTYVTEPEAKRLLKILRADRAAHVAFILLTSARDSEVSRAEKGDIDKRAGHVVVRGTKTERAARIVPITSLTRWLVDIVSRGASKGRHLFSPWTNQRRDLEIACTKLRIGRHIPATGTLPDRWILTANDFRRSLATWLVQRGVEPYIVAKVLGHTDARMVERVYGQMSTAALAKVLADRLATSARRSGTKVGHNRSKQPRATGPTGERNA